MSEYQYFKQSYESIKVTIENLEIIYRKFRRIEFTKATAPPVSSFVDQLIENVEKWLDLVQPGYASLSSELSLSLPLIPLTNPVKVALSFFFCF